MDHHGKKKYHGKIILEVPNGGINISGGGFGGEVLLQILLYLKNLYGPKVLEY